MHLCVLPQTDCALYSRPDLQSPLRSHFQMQSRKALGPHWLLLWPAVSSHIREVPAREPLLANEHPGPYTWLGSKHSHYVYLKMTQFHITHFSLFDRISNQNIKFLYGYTVQANNFLSSLNFVDSCVLKCWPPQPSLLSYPPPPQKKKKKLKNFIKSRILSAFYLRLNQITVTKIFVLTNMQF